jgi:hypothetical protein
MTGNRFFPHRSEAPRDEQGHRFCQGPVLPMEEEYLDRCRNPTYKVVSPKILGVDMGVRPNMHL